MEWTLYDYIVICIEVLFLWYPCALLAVYCILFYLAPGVIRK